MLVLTFSPRATDWSWLARPPPALTFVLTFRPRATVWLWLSPPCLRQTSVAPALTPLLTLRPRATVWLWFCQPPTLTPLLTFKPRATEEYVDQKATCDDLRQADGETSSEKGRRPGEGA